MNLLPIPSNNELLGENQELYNIYQILDHAKIIPINKGLRLKPFWDTSVKNGDLKV